MKLLKEGLEMTAEQAAPVRACLNDFSFEAGGGSSAYPAEPKRARGVEPPAPPAGEDPPPPPPEIDPLNVAKDDAMKKLDAAQAALLALSNKMKQGLTEVAGVLERLGTHEWASVENGAVCHLQEATKVQSKACDNAFSMWAATKRDFSMPKSKSVDELQDQTKMLDDTTAQISGAYIKYRKNELGAFINVKAATADEE